MLGDPHDLELMALGIPVLVTKQTAAKRIGRSPETIRRWVKDGRIESMQFEGKTMVRIGDVELVGAQCENTRQSNLAKGRIARLRTK